MRRSIRLVPVALLVCSLAALFLSRGAETVPLYAAREGLLCQNCHFDPNGGGPRNEFGFSYARNRHSVEAESDSASPWASLDLTNKVGETMPLHVSINQRFMLLTNTTVQSDSLDRFGFFNMENAIHFAFQPHPQLTLVYTMDAFSPSRDTPGNFRSKDAFGMIGGLPLNGYLKAGRFRNPFGLRMDDHTVATRNSFLDFSTQETFLPYDQRDPDLGVELGGTFSSFYGRMAFTNGPSSPAGPAPFAETKSIKVGYNTAWYQSGFSFYDEYNKEHTASSFKRATRWGYFGIGHYGPLAALFEIAAGTDEAEPLVDGLASGAKTNRLAWFGELDWTPIRWWNARIRYDYLVVDRSSDPVIREANTHQRYAFETEVLPVPFAELRGVIRQIDHKASAIDDETQFYLQFHFNY